MNPLPHGFPFCQAVSFAVFLKPVECLLIKANAEPFVDGVLYLWPPCARAHLITSLSITPSTLGMKKSQEGFYKKVGRDALGAPRFMGTPSQRLAALTGGLG